MDKETLKNLLYKNESVADLAPETMAQADAFCEGYKSSWTTARPSVRPVHTAKAC